MGQNLSSTFVPDTSGVVLSPQDATADFILLGVWLGVLYVCAMIFSTCFLIDRWGDKSQTGGGSVLAAFMVSLAWPAVLAYMMASG
ncbi:hypothetical protein S40285_04766 [Stachybotrys chlorohalonatus IBT 40285]|uniref:Uncharacterized protein n=2 Tax=Stachybotrys TaxID=74721 RepID=A0A084QGN3_STAC4|nr:hypothetical protein S7711_09082 [Stachybotrys chartarum IBT 7711]KFA48310.1 hypothetical protein S40293_04501 [Stachybotrys chartarum IBT 40293]KFA63118.1 hypothetical protein S40285_04766 [Stachybotrys chlorohalonata IBT 40285]